MIPISPYFNVQSRRERDTLASFCAILLILRLFCAFRENFRILLAKIAFWEDWGEEKRFEEAQGIKNKAKRANGGRHGRASRRTAVRQNTTHDQPASNLALAGRAWWHDRSMCHGLAVPHGTAVPCVRRRGLICSRFFLSADFSFRVFPYFFLLLEV